MDEIYLDNSATTMVCTEAIKEATNVMAQNYGNPSSVHAKGLMAESVLDSSRKAIAKVLGCEKQEIYFTSGGTESNNIAILGCIPSQKRYGNKIVTTAIEHSCVLAAMSELEKRGFRVEYLKPDSYGMISSSQIAAAVDKDTILVSIMAVNNEIGSILPIHEVKNIIKYKNSHALFHVDAVQAFCKVPLNVNRLGVDFLSTSAHKLHGPKGVGALYISRRAISKVKPIMFGGGQESGISPGTEPMPAIAGFGEAVIQMVKRPDSHQRVFMLNDYFRKLISKNANIRVNSPPNACPYIINISINRIKAETMVNFLSSHGIYVSNGSACSKGNRSHVLTAMGLPEDVIDSSIRISFSRYNRKEEIDKLVICLNEGIRTLARF